MKVTVKSMKAGTFEVEADISKPVRLIKEAIYAEKKSDDLHPDAQRLIFSGRLLKDDDVLESLNFKENDFLVVMGGKRPAASKPAADKKDTASSKSEETPASSSTTEPKPASTTTSSSTPAAPSSGPAASEESLNTLTAMGFDRAQAERALSAAFGNIERAVEYLQNGIPTSAQPAAHQQGEQQQQQGEGEADSTTEEPTAESTTEASQGLSPDSPIAFLHIDPAFNQLRRLVHQNPAHLPSLLQHLASSNPDLVQLINDNQEDFYHLINAPSVAAMPQGPPPGAQGLQLSPEDAEAIERLVAFGFDRATAAQAYFACDKDENAAANWLFEHGNE